jgi:TolA-binding protein
MARRDPRFSSGPGWKHEPPRRYGAPPRWYRASRRRTLLRLAIPAAIGVTIAGFAIGAAVAYFADGQSDSPRPAAAKPRPHAAPTTTRAGTSTPRGSQPATGAGTVTAQPRSPAEGHRLNDEGFALIRGGNYAAAIPPLRAAVGDLAGSGPADPYEAYADYNLGYALLRTGRCTEAIAPLEAADRLETNPAVDRALGEARRCAPIGS